MAGNNIKKLVHHRADLRTLYKEVHKQGGRARVKEVYDVINRAYVQYNRSNQQSPAPNRVDNQLYNLERKVRRKEATIEKLQKEEEYYEPINTISTSSSKTFVYNTKKPNEVTVGGAAIRCSIHPTTKRHRSGNKKLHDCRWQYFATQWAIRKYPEPWNKLDANSKDEENLALHSDTFDVNSLNANLYRSGGGSDGKGGAVPGTDLMLFESISGGESVRVKTCMRDTVVLVLTNSNQQLHSGIKSSQHFVHDPSVWSTRYIPFITKGAYWWAQKNPDGVPINNLTDCDCNLI